MSFPYRFSWGSGHSANGASGEVNNDSVAQMGFLPWQLWWWTEGPSSPEKDTVTSCLCWFWSVFIIQSTIWHRFLLCSSLNWVTPQMLSVPFPDKKTAVNGDPFLPAITGEQVISCIVRCKTRRRFWYAHLHPYIHFFKLMMEGNMLTTYYKHQ